MLTRSKSDIWLKFYYIYYNGVSKVTISNKKPNQLGKIFLNISLYFFLPQSCVWRCFRTTRRSFCTGLLPCIRCGLTTLHLRQTNYENSGMEWKIRIQIMQMQYHLVKDSFYWLSAKRNNYTEKKFRKQIHNIYICVRNCTLFV